MPCHRSIMSEEKQGRPFFVIALAVGMLGILSLLPWGKLTDGFFKDFNLLEDVMPSRPDKNRIGNELVDPDLESALSEMSQTVSDDMAGASDSVADAAGGMDVAVESPVSEGAVIIEDYTSARRGLSRFAQALDAGNSIVRVALVGDSYIEGDVLCQNLREGLQAVYGGRGVGFMALHSDIPGFRQSVIQSDKGWKLHDLRKDKGHLGCWLAGVYATGETGAKASFKGVSRFDHASSWNRGTLLYVAADDGVVTLDAGTGPIEYRVTRSDSVQAIVVEGEMKQLKIENRSVNGFDALGLWLDGGSGVSVDCMSLRGNSGAALRRLDAGLVGQMRRWIDYDLIIVEYGLNAVSSQQSDYSAYGKLMEQVIGGIMALYPGADILVMGIGDRGQKQGSEVHSLPTVDNMVATQREMARRLGVLFWDTRMAMGGADAVVDWRKRGLVNADYIHLNHKGGAELAGYLVDAIVKTAPLGSRHD